MLVQVVARFRVHDFARALAGHVAGDAACNRASHGADRATHGANRGTSQRAAGSAGALGQVVLMQTVFRVRIHDFARARPRPELC